MHPGASVPHCTVDGAHGSVTQSQSTLRGWSGEHSAAPQSSASNDSTSSGASHWRPSAASHSTSTLVVHSVASSGSVRSTTTVASRIVRTGPQFSATSRSAAPQPRHDPARHAAVAWSRCASQVTPCARPAWSPTSSTSHRHADGAHPCSASTSAVWRSHATVRMSHRLRLSGRSAPTHGAGSAGS